MQNFTRDELFEGMKQYYLQHKQEPNVLLYPKGATIDGIHPRGKIAGMLAIEVDPEVTAELLYGKVEGLKGYSG